MHFRVIMPDNFLKEGRKLRDIIQINCVICHGNTRLTDSGKAPQLDKKYPMWVIKVSDFLNLSTFPTHQDLKQDGKLHMHERHFLPSSFLISALLATRSF